MLRNWWTGRAATRSSRITTHGIAVEVMRKRIKHFYLRVDRAEGRVRVSAPLAADDDEVAAVIARRVGWIKRQQANVAAAPPRPRLRYASGETHFLWGQPLLLEVVERAGRGSRVELADSTLTLHIRRRSRFEQRQRAMHDWHRHELKARIPELIACWEPVLGVRVAEWNVKRMRTRWGTCNIRARRIWLNLELTRYPVECLEYVVVHEMVHLLERYHNAHFRSLLDRCLPDWRERQRTLGRPLAAHYKQGHGNDDQIDACDG
jgi:predicted metal-dependent hydrolase